MPIINRVAEYQDELTAWRRHLHEHPEVAFEEYETARFVAEKLETMGVDAIHKGLAGTGVVATIKGGENSRCIGLRADMDALPIQEATGLPYASRNAGKMHACGHDGHTTMLLGAARYLAETRNFDGTVHLIFQPAEEGHGGGRRMVEEGLFDKFPVEQVFGLHNWPSLDVGAFGMCPERCMAASDEVRVSIKGRGCHAAMPHRGRDPIPVALLITQAFQGLIAREIDPLDAAVISITQIHAGNTYNVVPEDAFLDGTVRTYQDATRNHIRQRMEEIVAGIAQAQGVEATLDYRVGYPPTINAAIEAELGADTAAEIVGDERVERNPEPTMGAEDFAFMLKEKPGSYIWMGIGAMDETKGLHSPHYDFNDEAMPYGVSYWARLVERLMPRAT
ncbi:MAG: M20 aminoacylase family protein [Pseudomonadota bacterium]